MKKLLPLFLLFTLNACGPALIASDVMRFHDLPAQGEGLSFTIHPDDSQRGSLEFQAYAQRVAEALQRFGYRPKASLKDGPDLVVFMRYGVDGGRTELRTIPVYGRSGYDYYNYPWGGRYDITPVPQIDSFTVFTRKLEVDILDARLYQKGEIKKRFEGRAFSEGSSRALPVILPYLVNALFDRFPGTSGEIMTVRVPQDH